MPAALTLPVIRRRDRAGHRPGPGRGWLAWAAAGVAATLGYLLLPPGTLLSNVVYDVIGLTSAAVIVLGVRRRRPPRPAMWYWMAGGQATWVLGDVVYTVYQNLLNEPPFPSLADVFYLVAYPLIVVGLIALIRARRGGSDVAGLLDAGIVTTGLGLLSWTFLIRPVLADPETSLLSRLVSVAYPTADIVLLGMIGWLLTTAGARTACYRLLVTAMLLLLASDVAFSLLTAFANYEGGITDAGWLLSYVLWAAAAMHPSAPQLARPGSHVGTVSRTRLAVLGMALVIAPAMSLVQGAVGSQRVDWLGAGIGGVILCALALARFAHLLARTTRLAHYDDLTGLGNRRMLELWLDALPDGDAQLAVIDLDDFQEINDRLGRDTGDAVLVAVAGRLTATLDPGQRVARIGGDKFALLLPGTSAEVADMHVAALRRRFQLPVAAGADHLPVKVRVGIADAAADITPGEWLRRADVAVHAAARVGADGYVRYRPELDEKADGRVRLAAALRTALDESQLELYYQPIVTLPDGRLAAVEALVRWQHPTAGLISPAEFIPAAETNGLIVELGRWVMERACRQLLQWDARLGAAAPARISVNVSARQLAEPDFAGVVAEILAATGVPATRLTIEVTETAVFEGGRAVEALRAVQALGVRIALDDFGTGHSSLALLRECPVDVLKVDKSFVDHITGAGRQAVIASALIDISSGLHLTAVAEGVETAAQAEALHGLGYRFAQGYLFGRPVPADELSLFRPGPLASFIADVRPPEAAPALRSAKARNRT